MSVAFQPATDCLSEKLNTTPLPLFGDFAAHHQANSENNLPLPETRYNSSVHHSTKVTPSELDIGYELPLPQDMIADAERPQSMEPVITFQNPKFIERLQRNLAVARDERHNAQD